MEGHDIQLLLSSVCGVYLSSLVEIVVPMSVELLVSVQKT